MNGHANQHVHGDASHDAAAQARDPVCGMKVDPQTAAGPHEHHGVKHYFCGTGCLEKFKADPEKYLKGGAAPVTHAAVKDATYTCPMHPEIIRDAPGDCPICGMALVPIAGTGEADDSELRDLTRRFWTGAALSVPLVVLAMAPMVGFHEPFGLAPRARGWVEFALGTPVVLWVGWPILRKFWISLANRNLNMYTLIGLGVALAYLFSLAARPRAGNFSSGISRARRCGGNLLRGRGRNRDAGVARRCPPASGDGPHGSGHQRAVASGAQPRVASP